MNLKKSLLIALIVGIAAITSWELFWRSKGFEPGLEDTKELWAVQRSRVDKADNNDIVLLGDSRMLFDIQLDPWEEETGVRPIQLASAGTTPLPAFHDLVENTEFSGTAVISVHPIIFFFSTQESDFLWNRIKSRIDHFYDRTYAQRLNHILDIPLQRSFTFMRADDEDWTDDLDLKTLLGNVRLGDRTIGGYPPFYRFQDIEIDRNVKMFDKVVKDTAFANSIIKAWTYQGPEPMPPPDKAGTTAFFLKDLEKFKARGGKVILIRFPSSGGLLQFENEVFSRENYWEEIVAAADVPAYHFEDYEQLNQFYCPEWSHLSAQDASTFTTELARILIKDQVINN
jgi:hypothetical protein